MRFYLYENPHCTHLLRCCLPRVFAQILDKFARVFSLALGEMLRRFRAQGSQAGHGTLGGRGGSRSAGSLLFHKGIERARVLVLGPLKTMESLTIVAWPCLDPQLLDLRQGEGRLDVMQWPRIKYGRPIFLHVASLGFHCGAEVGASRQSLIWLQYVGA